MNLEGLQHLLEHVRPTVLFHLGEIPVTTTVVNTWIIMIIVFLLAFLISRRVSTKPQGIQNLVELVAEFFYDLLEDNMGKEGRKFLPLVGTLFIFILLLNLSWFIPEMKPPTTDLSTTAGFALVTILLVQLIGIKKQGLVGYIKHFFQPSPFLFPINVVEELVKPVSLALRLFANMFGEKTVSGALFIMFPLLLPLPVMALGVIMGLVQALVFSLLTVVYISAFVKGH
ncbi:MAG TPA: F0F1 ATP synthase subunit A [Bacillota bacterium]|nr:F0F1 ATP synthase subunit A [Bacillota bacterium]HOB86313.1 F0F1 ATP synthase subunit A [Bacillota bacterium]HOP69606.1 F0F1 ATP synthase subunit A [Bacillota bacterium]HPT34841.1 F0F1 ATP synthase subunit A [Bacillota bacterium]HPZ64979.1 F0F1 ATP synthase subunit A [Bacillota bacterium]